MPPVIVRHSTGRLWLNVGRLTSEQARNLTTFDLIEYRGLIYELQGQRPSDGWWWIEKINHELTDEEVAKIGGSEAV